MLPFYVAYYFPVFATYLYLWSYNLTRECYVKVMRISIRLIFLTLLGKHILLYHLPKEIYYFYIYYFIYI